METPFPPQNTPDTEQSGRQTVLPLAHTPTQHPPVEPPPPPGPGVRADFLKRRHHHVRVRARGETNPYFRCLLNVAVTHKRSEQKAPVGGVGDYDG